MEQPEAEKGVERKPGSTLWVTPEAVQGPEALTPTYGYQSRIVNVAPHSEPDTASRDEPKPVDVAPVFERVGPAPEPTDETTNQEHYPVIYDNNGAQVWPPLGGFQGEPVPERGMRGLPAWATTLAITVAVVLVTLGTLATLFAASFFSGNVPVRRYATPHELNVMRTSSVACANAVEQLLPKKTVEFLDVYDPTPQEVSSGVFHTGGTLGFINTTEEPYVHDYACTVELNGDNGHISHVIVQNPADDEPLVDYVPDNQDEFDSQKREDLVTV